MRSSRHAALLAPVALLLLLATAGPAGAVGPASGTSGPARDMIVLLRPGASVTEALDHGRRLSVHPTNAFRHAVHGYAAALTPAQVVSLRADPAVASIVPDDPVYLEAQTTPAGIRRVHATDNPIAHIDGLDQRVNVDVAIIDTGIQPDHPDLVVAGGYNCTTSTRSNWKDEHGHGTHVAGIVGAKDNTSGVVGVAPGARLWAIRVFDKVGFSKISWIVCGIDWITGHKAAGTTKPLIEVANMSLRDPGSDDGNCGRSNNDPEHQAICRSVAAGTTYVVAAGNQSLNAGTGRPAAYNEVVTVSALADFDGLPGGLAGATCQSLGSYDVDDTYANFSNYGADVDMIAPGVCVRSTYLNSTTAVISGTSMATPTVAGGAALFIAAHPGASPSTVRSALRAAGADDWRQSTDRDSTHEPLLDVTTFGAGPSLRLSATPASPRTWRGLSPATSALKLFRGDGLGGTVALSVKSAPPELDVSLSQPALAAWTQSFGLTAAAKPGTPAGTYPVVVRAQIGTVADEVTVNIVVNVDDVAPTTTNPTEGLVAASSSSVSNSGPKVRTAWSGSDTGGSGLVKYELGERRGSGLWKGVGLSSPTSTSRVGVLPFSLAIVHRSRATDLVGNVGTWAQAARFILTGLSENTSAAHYTAGWTSYGLTGTWGGRVRSAARVGMAVSFDFTGRSVGWVSTYGPDRGKASVYIDGTLVKTVDLKAAVRYSARMAFAANVAAGPHTLRIVSQGTAGRPRVDVDGFVVMQ
ncbi:MAG: S8 family serine peptidase [Chloroflexota bacterium]